MPKKPKAKRGAETIRVAAPPNHHYPGMARRIGSLVVVQGAEADLGRHILCDQPITIGRGDSAELTLSDGSISRAHCRVEADAKTGHYLLVDLGSTNGTILNGRRIDKRFPLADGDKIFLGASALRFTYADGVDLEYHTKLEELVTTDSLTGLASRRQYDVTFPIFAERAEAENAPLSLLVMDMDGLKQINDTHGHEMGGFAIVEVSTILRALLCDHGLVCRFGGDEFVAALFGLRRARAIRLAEQVRDHVARHDFIKGDIRVQPTISIGVAAYPEDTSRPAQLFTIADQALYSAKRAGRNRVAYPDPTPDPPPEPHADPAT